MSIPQLPARRASDKEGRRIAKNDLYRFSTPLPLCHSCVNYPIENHAVSKCSARGILVVPLIDGRVCSLHEAR